jgi:hypothetical protein
MDERRLSELLRDAVADAPPPTFDQKDVARESERQRVRMRNGILTGSALGVALLAGVTALSVALWTGTDSSGQPNAAAGAEAPGNGSAAPYELEEERAAEPPDQDSAGDIGKEASPETRKQGRPSDEEAKPLGPGGTPRGCEQADRELAAALAGELPAAALPPDYTCSVGMPNVTFMLDSGALTVTLVGQDSAMSATDQPGMAFKQAEAATDDGRVVVIVSSAPDPGPTPLADELEELAGRVADQY